MSRIIFDEKQTIRQVTWMWWVIIPVTAGIILSILYNLYWQIIMNEPIGTKPMSDTGLISVSILSFVICGLVIWILLSVQLNVTIDHSGILYRYYPHMRQWKQIVRSSVLEYEVRKLNFLESRKRGYRRSILGKHQRMIIHGRYALILKLNDGKKLTIGTQKPQALESAVKKLMSSTNQFD